MITDDWKSDSNHGQNENENSRERRFQSSNYSNSENKYRENYGRPENRTSYNNYQRDENYNRPTRSFGNNQQIVNANDSGAARKRRPRVGETPMPIRNTNNYSGRDNYNRDREGSYNNNRDNYNRGGYGNRDNQSNRSGGYNRDNRGSGYSQHPQGRNNNFGQRRPNNNRQGNYNSNAKYSFQKQLKYREENFDPNEPIRLNKYLANAGVCSRREADEFIKAGVVKVNGEVASELGVKVKRADQVTFHDQPIKLEHKVYVLLNKPKNCVTTADDPQERFTVMDLVKNACHERIFPVGRLDRNTTGVILLTNDGDLASKLTHPKFLKKKIYHVWLNKEVSIADMQKLADGIELEDGEIHADAISYVGEDSKDQVGIEIHSGRNRIVRRMFETLGYHIIKLDRVYFAGLTKKNLKRGQWRFLSEKEVSMLRMGAFE
ncbi:MAG: rRNA pseudouridine synthase [Dysgonamonadaceae bacterium]|jgi:23S rRNA pseudouridine2605 synthase|nr:rRNA pseudouridine synthase [Dysgonamonadaceae bacterium]